jgi:hypothetical protein
MLQSAGSMQLKDPGMWNPSPSLCGTHLKTTCFMGHTAQDSSSVEFNSPPFRGFMTSLKTASAKEPKAWDADKWDGTGTSLIVSTSVWRWPHFGYENDGTSAWGRTTSII